MADTALGFNFQCPAADELETPHPNDAARTSESQEFEQVQDAALLSGLRAGEEAAYETLILRFEHTVYSVVTRMLDEPADAADVVQEVFLKVFRKIGTFRAESSLKTWIYRIALNEARNHRRWFGRHRAKEVGLELDLQHWNGWDHEFSTSDWLEDGGQSPYEVALDHEMHTLVEQGLLQLSANHRAALVLREVEGLTYDEIAEILEIPAGTVKSRILRARDCLRKELTALVKPHVTVSTASTRSEGDRFAATGLKVQGRDAV